MPRTLLTNGRESVELNENEKVDKEEVEVVEDWGIKNEKKRYAYACVLDKLARTFIPRN